MLLDLALVIILIVLSACFSATETAIFSLGLIRLRTLAAAGNHSAKLLEKMRENPQTVLGAILLGNNVVNIGAGTWVTVIVIEHFGSAAVGIAAGILTLIILIFGEILPKTYAAHHNEKVALVVARPAYWLTLALSPILQAIDAFSRLVLRLKKTAVMPHVGEEEIKTMATMGVKAGTLETGEKELIERVFLMNDVTANDVMTPRENIVCLDGRKTLSEALPVIQSSQYSRYPVFENEKNNVIGAIHIKDIFERLAENPGLDLNSILIRDVAEPVPFVPKTKPIDDLLREMQRQHIHIAMVVNELGSISGLVTFEDLLEELVGEIADESDVDDRVIKRVDKLTVICHGDVEIKDVNRFFNVKIAAPPHKSLAWVILKELGSIPVKGQQIQIAENVTATIEEMLNLRVHKVRLTKTDGETAGT